MNSLSDEAHCTGPDSGDGGTASSASTLLEGYKKEEGRLRTGRPQQCQNSARIVSPLVNVVHVVLPHFCDTDEHGEDCE